MSVSTLPPPPQARWGLGDAALAVPVTFAVVIAVTLPVAFVVGLDNEPALTAVSALAQAVAFIGWPVLVTHWKGRRSLRIDFGWSLRFPLDLGIGLLGAIGALVVGVTVAATVSTLLGVDLDDVDNTQILSDAESTSWQWVLLAVVALVIPIGEELLFRGLLYGAFAKRWGTGVAVAGSTFLFTLPHWVGDDLATSTVLWSQIAVYGAVFAGLRAVTGRLGPAIVAHVLINSMVSVVVLTG